MFWNNKPKAPVTDEDRDWIEDSLKYLINEFGYDKIKNLKTITPTTDYFDYNFKGTEKDAEYLLNKIMSLMDIKGWRIKLMFYSEQPLEFSEGVLATPSKNLKGGWKGSAGRYVDKGYGKKEVWIEMGQLMKPQSLIATISHELSHYKLLGENRIEENDEYLTDLTAISYGFGIFISNSLFDFSQWTGSTHQGWQMNNKGYLPEQMVAYAIALLIKFREESIDIERYLNKSSYKYYKKSIVYLNKNPERYKYDR